MNDNFGLKGNVELILRDKDGNVIDHRDVENAITNVGYDAICAQIGNQSQPNDFYYTGIGTSSAVFSGADTTLGTELTRVENVYAHSIGTKNFTSTATYAATVGTGAITESGLLNANSAGTLLNRVVFAVINKGADDSLEIVWTITLS